MKKKLFIGTVLPSIAALAVIGSGFSLWIFNDSNSVKTTGSVGIDVTNVAKIGTLTVTGEDTYLNFDQLNTVTNPSNPKGTGLTFKSEADGELQKVSYTKDGSATYYTDYEAGVTDITFTTTIVVPANLAKYIDLSYSVKNLKDGVSVSFGSEQDSGSKTSYTLEVKASQMSSFDSTNGTDIFDWDNMSATYVTANYPDTLEKYKTMRSELGVGSESSLAFSATYQAVLSVVE